jgi:hypothetical protein
MSADKGVENSSEAEWSREVMFRAAVKPSVAAAGEPSLVRTPRSMTMRAHLWTEFVAARC